MIMHYEINVTGLAIVSQYVEVDADSEDEAIEIATNMALQQTSEFDIDNIDEITDADVLAVWNEDDE
jgi:hypothetical protein